MQTLQLPRSCVGFLIKVTHTRHHSIGTCLKQGNEPERKNGSYFWEMGDDTGFVCYTCYRNERNIASFLRNYLMRNFLWNVTDSDCVKASEEWRDYRKDQFMIVLFKAIVGDVKGRWAQSPDTALWVLQLKNVEISYGAKLARLSDHKNWAAQYATQCWTQVLC